MIATTCHCGAVRIGIPHAPERISMCDCSVCRRYGALWAYCPRDEVSIEAPAGGLARYSRPPRSIAFVRCAACGCVTPWEALAAERGPRTGVNARNFRPEQIGPAIVRLIDGTVTETVIGERLPDGRHRDL